MAVQLVKQRVLLVLALLLLVATAGVVTVGHAIRRDGQGRLRAVLQRHAAEGHGATFADLAAEAPAVSGDRQARLRAWMKRPGQGVTGFSSGRDLAWRVNGHAAPRDTVLESHEAFRADAEELAELLAAGDLCLTSLGWLPEDPAGSSFADRMGGFIPNLLRVRSAHTWYALEATLAEDPTAALDALDRLHAGLARPGCLIDAMIAVACDSMRDDVFVVYAREGRVPAERVEAWLAQPPRGRGLTADGLRGERLRFGAPLGQDLVAGGSLPEHFGAGWGVEGVEDVWQVHIRPWVYGAGECATHLETMLALERNLRGEIEREALDAHLAAHEELGFPFSLMMPNFDGMLVMARDTEDRHRFTRLAVALLQESVRREHVPHSPVEAWSWVRLRRPHLLPADGEEGYRYVRLAPDRFRLGRASEDDGDALDGLLGAPASPTPLSLGHEVLELSLPTPDPSRR